MKKFIFLGLMLIISGSVFCQSMDKEQTRKAKEINRQSQRQLNEVIKHPTMTDDEKKSQIAVVKSARDTQLSIVLTTEQMLIIQDPINWQGAVKKVDKQGFARLRVERDQKLRDLGREERELQNNRDDLRKQIKELQRREKNIKDQQKVLKQRKKEINRQYK